LLPDTKPTSCLIDQVGSIAPTNLCAAVWEMIVGRLIRFFCL
jgi:hypothetical protein